MKNIYLKRCFILLMVLGIVACTSSNNTALKLPPDKLASTINNFGTKKPQFHDAAALCSHFYAYPNEPALFDTSLKKMCPNYVKALKVYLDEETLLKGLSEADLKQPELWQHYLLSKKAHGRGFN